MLTKTILNKINKINNNNNNNNNLKINKKWNKRIRRKVV